MAGERGERSWREINKNWIRMGKRSGRRVWGRIFRIRPRHDRFCINMCVIFFWLKSYVLNVCNIYVHDVNFWFCEYFPRMISNK